MKIISILLMFTLLFGCKGKFKKSANAEWASLPKDFVEFDVEFGREAEWEYSEVKILDGKYKIGVGPFSFKEPNDGKYDYFNIDVEEDSEDVSLVIIQLPIDLKYVSENKLNAKAEEIVSFDSKTNLITFDLGKSVFKCQLLLKDKK